MRGMAPISIHSPAVVDAITLNKQGLHLWQRLMANNERQLQKADMMKALLPCCNYVQLPELLLVLLNSSNNSMCLCLLADGTYFWKSGADYR